MDTMLSRQVTMCCLVAFLLPISAHAVDDCSEELALIDERIADKPDDQRKQHALQIRQSFEMGCEWFDPDTRSAMMENLDKLYPTESAEEQAAQREAQSAERKAEREAKKAAESAKEAERVANQSAVLKVAPTGHSIASQHVPRDEDMHNLLVLDWDIYQGNLRILYTTAPSLPQHGRPDWQNYVYVIEVTPQGKPQQSLITSKQASDHEALVLRRGHDELLFVRQLQQPNQPMFFERWSISESRLLSSVDMTDAELEADGMQYRNLRMGGATSDGNTMFWAFQSGRDAGSERLAWFKMTPDGETLASGSLPPLQDKVNPWAWFERNDGGAGLVTRILALTDTGLKSGELAGFDDSAAGFHDSMNVTVASETRAYLIGTNAEFEWESVALERMMMVGFAGPQPAPTNYEEMNAKVHAPLAAQTLAETKYHSGRKIDYVNIGTDARPMIKPMGDGYAALITHVANNDLEPSIHGQYLVMFDDEGIRNEHYLNPIAEQIGGDFTVFEPGTEPGEFYLLANPKAERGYVIQLDADGKPTAYAHTGGRVNFTFERTTLVSDDEGVWLFGGYWPDGTDRPMVWVERIVFP